MNNRVRILVTGGSGFIGTNVIDFYLAKGFEVLNIDREAPRNKNHHHLWKRVDILDMPGLKKIIFEFNPTHVFHLAARTDLNEKKSLEGYKANSKGVENIIEVLNKCDRLERVLFTSSMYVCSPGYSPSSYEDYSPHTVYGESKVLSEKIVKNSTISNFEWVIIRPTSLWGPWFGIPYNEFFKRVLNGTYFKIIGKTATKTFGFVFNSIYQMDRLLFCDKSLVHKKTFYIGDSPALNINDWADEIALQAKKKLISVPLIVVRSAGWFGDFLSLFKIRFPLQSFRVKNMTTDNVILLLDDTLKIAPDQPHDTKAGVAITLEWIKSDDAGLL